MVSCVLYLRLGGCGGSLTGRCAVGVRFTYDACVGGVVGRNPYDEKDIRVAQLAHDLVLLAQEVEQPPAAAAATAATTAAAAAAAAVLPIAIDSLETLDGVARGHVRALEHLPKRATAEGSDELQISPREIPRGDGRPPAGGQQPGSRREHTRGAWGQRGLDETGRPLRARARHGARVAPAERVERSHVEGVQNGAKGAQAGAAHGGRIRGAIGWFVKGAQAGAAHGGRIRGVIGWFGGGRSRRRQELTDGTRLGRRVWAD